MLDLRYAEWLPNRFGGSESKWTMEYEEKNSLYMSVEMQHLYADTKYDMKEGDISSDDREKMLNYFGELLYG